MRIEGVVRRFFKQANSDAPATARFTSQGSFPVAPVEPPNAEAARAGRRFGGGCQIIANGIAPVTAIPTTTATLALYNGEEDGGASYLIDRLNFWLGSGTPTAGATLMVAESAGPIATVPTAMATGYEAASLSGSSSGTKALFATAVTLPLNPTWVGILSTFQLAAANVGQGDGWAQLDGGILIRPRRALGIAILSGTGTSPLYGVSVQWTELELDLE